MEAGASYRVGVSRSAAWLLASVALLVLAGWSAAGARAADTIFFIQDSTDTVSSAALAGGGPVNSLYPYVFPTEPAGVSVNPQEGTLIWGLPGTGLQTGSTAGGGAATTLYPGDGFTLAVDPVAGLVYSSDGDSIERAPLDGSGPVAPVYSSLFSARLPVPDPAAGRVYWTSSANSQIWGAPLDGSGPGTVLYDGSDGVSLPNGLALDPAAGTLYWSNITGGGTIQRGPVSGVGAPQTLYSGQNPRGVAVDPDAGRVYWSAYGGGGDALRSAPMAGGGPIIDLHTGLNGPYELSILKAPAPIGTPAVSGSGQIGQELTCSDIDWENEGVSTRVYNGPESEARQWLRDGAAIPGATGTAFTPTGGGSYACGETATNAAGSTSQTSAPVDIADPPGPPATNPAPTGPPAKKCNRLRKKLKRWQARKLALARTGKKRAHIQANITDTKRRLKKLGC
jgi:hypothetical protein